MSRIACLICLALLTCLTATALAAEPASQTKAGVIQSADATARTVTVALAARPLTFTVDDSTVITLDGQPSTFAAALKPQFKAAVTYTKTGEQRLASRIQVTSTASATQPAAGQTKSGVVQSADDQAHTFVLTLPARPLTFTVNEQTTIALDGQPATFAALKPGVKASVTYTRSGDQRLASKVEVTSAK